MSFFDMLGMFDPGDGPRGPRRDSGATDDDPVIVDVQADGDDHGETPSAGKGEPPKRGVPRLTPRPLPNGPSKGTKILIGVVLALVVVVGLFFGLSQFITDLMGTDSSVFRTWCGPSWVSSSACGRRMRC